MKRNVSLTFLFLFSIASIAQPPPGYYNGTQGLSGQALKSSLNQIISNHTSFPYTSSSGTDVWDILEVLDEDPNDNSKIMLIYKRVSIPKNNRASGANSSQQDYWNREHVWPLSLMGVSNTSVPGTDVHHLRASDVSVNGDRANKDFDNGGSPHPEATQCNYTSNTWEVPNAVKGDVARMMFYMATRYEGNGSDPDLELNEIAGNASGSERLGKLSTLLQWHAQDPVDAVEIQRNNLIFSQYQGNRNPYIDNPNFVTLVFDSANAVKPEPANHVSNFNFSKSITVSWQAFSTAPPSGILVKMSAISAAAISDPVDGNFEPDGSNAKNVAGTADNVVFDNLTPGTYYFKVFPYNGSGSSVNYKTSNAPVVTYQVSP